MLSRGAITKTTGILALVVLVVASVGAYYVYTPQAPTAPEKPAREAILVGYPASITGRFETLGKQGLHGIQMWAEDVNKQGGIFVKEYGKKIPVKVVYFDDKSDKDTTLRLTERLILEEKADFLFSPYSSGLAFAAAPIAEKQKKIMLAWGASSDDIWTQGWKYIVGIYTPASLYQASALEFLKSKIPKARVAFITEDEIFSVSSHKGGQAKAKELGFEIVYVDRYPQNPTDLSPILLKLKEIKPDAIFADGHLKDNVLIVKQLAEYKVDVKLISITSGAAAATFWKDVGPSTEYVLAPSQWEPVEMDPTKIPNWFGEKISPRKWADKFKERWGYEPDYRAASAIGAALTLHAAIEKAGSIDTEKVRTALTELDIVTILGRYKVDPNTLNQIGHEMLLVQWIKGKKVVVGPPEFAEATPVYPIPMWEERAKR